LIKTKTSSKVCPKYDDVFPWPVLMCQLKDLQRYQKKNQTN
jgi:hypothetical protein